MDYKEFEERLNKKAQDFDHGGIDQDSMWSTIESELPEKKRRRFIWFFLFGIAAALLVWFNQFDQVELAGPNTVVEQLPAEEIQRSDHLTQETYKEETSKVNHQVGQQDEVKVVEKIKQVGETVQPSLNNAKLNVHRSLQIESTTAEVSKTFYSEIKQPSNIVIPTGEAEDQVEDAVEYLEELSKEITTAAEPADVTVDKQVTEQISEEIEDEVTEDKSTLINEVSDKKLVAQDAFQLIANEEQSSIVAEENEAEKSEADIAAVIISRTTPRLVFGISAGIYQPQIKYRTIGSDNNDYLNLLKNSERNLEALDLRLSAGFQLGSHWRVSTGITYSSIQQESRNTNTFEREKLVPDAVIGTVNSFGETYPLIGEGLERSMVTQNYKRHLSYKSIAAPLVLHYSSGFSKKWNFQLHGGIEYSLRGWGSGFLQDLNEQEYDLSEDQEGRLSNRSSHYAIAGIDIQRRLSEKVGFHLGLESKMSLTELNNQNSLVQKRFVLPGVRSGLVFIF